MLRGSGSHPRADGGGAFSLWEQRDRGRKPSRWRRSRGGTAGARGESSLGRKCLPEASAVLRLLARALSRACPDSQRPATTPRAPPLPSRLETARHAGLRVRVTASRKPALLAPCRPTHNQWRHFPLLGGAGEIDYWRSHSLSGGYWRFPLPLACPLDTLLESNKVSHPSTNQARPCLASEIRDDRARSAWCGGRRLLMKWTLSCSTLGSRYRLWRPGDQVSLHASVRCLCHISMMNILEMAANPAQPVVGVKEQAAESGARQAFRGWRQS